MNCNFYLAEEVNEGTIYLNYYFRNQLYNSSIFHLCLHFVFILKNSIKSIQLVYKFTKEKKIVL